MNHHLVAGSLYGAICTLLCIEKSNSWTKRLKGRSTKSLVRCNAPKGFGVPIPGLNASAKQRILAWNIISNATKMTHGTANSL